MHDDNMYNDRFLVDDILLPTDTPKVLYRSLSAMRNKREMRPAKKQGTIPM